MVEVYWYCSCYRCSLVIISLGSPVVEKGVVCRGDPSFFQVDRCYRIISADKPLPHYNVIQHSGPGSLLRAIKPGEDQVGGILHSMHSRLGSRRHGGDRDVKPYSY